MTYVEFPADQIVSVHWHKKKNGNGNGGDPSDLPCGAFRHGYGLYDQSVPIIHYGDLPGQSLFILAPFNIYGIGFDIYNPGRDPLKPYQYWWSTADYVGGAISDSQNVPYIWGSVPDSWTLTVDFAEQANRLERFNPDRGFVLDSVFIEEYRNINIQAWASGSWTSTTPDRIIEGTTAEILGLKEGEVFSPSFRVIRRIRIPGTANFIDKYPPTLVQAHCKNETIGGYPPQYTNGNPYYQYPAPGQTDWPVRPPPPPPPPPPYDWLMNG